MGLGSLAETSLFVKLGMVIGAAPLVVGIWYAIRPDELRLALMRPLSLAALFAAVACLLNAVANALHAVGTSDPGDGGLGRHAASMLAEAVIPSFLGFAFLTAAWLLVAIGTRRSRLLVALIGCLAAFPGTASAQGRPQPLDPIPAIVEAFRTYPIVALGEGEHGHEQSAAFRLSLIRDPRFAAAVNDIVVEFGNARYQELVDRFIAGGDVPREELRHGRRSTAPAHQSVSFAIRAAFPGIAHR